MQNKLLGATGGRVQDNFDMPTPDQAGAILTIDLGAIRENYRRLRAQLGGGRCAGVVKADGYGLGAAEVALALREEGHGAEAHERLPRQIEASRPVFARFAELVAEREG